MKTLATLVLAASMAALGCSSSDQANAGDTTTETGTTEISTELAQSSSPAQTPAAAKTPARNASGLSPAPEWKTVDVAGNVVSSDQFKGKIQIVDFWATWCGPCKIEIPHFIELQNKYKDDLAIVGMALDQVSRVVPYSKQVGINYANLIGDQRIVRDFGVGRSIPTTYVINQQGEIYRRYVGYRPKEIFERDIKTLLAQAAG